MPLTSTQAHLLRLATLAASLVLSGCASMTEDQCRQAQWQDVGLQDGLGGERETKILEHRQACSKIGIFPDEQRWLTGRAQGLASYCTANGGWTAGLANRVYLGVCADRDEPTFLSDHRAGLVVWRTRYELGENRDALVRLDGEMRKATSEDQKQRIREDVARHERERDRLILLLTSLELAGRPPR